MHSQNLQSRDLVFQQLLSFVKIWQHDLSLSVVGRVQLFDLSLQSLRKVLFMSPAKKEYIA